MAKKYVYIDGVRYEVVNNYILGLDVYSDGSIPTPTASDDGKVITVDEEGNYVLGEAGGSGASVVFCTFDMTDPKGSGYNTYFESDMTAEEIWTAMMNGTIVYAKFVGDNDYSVGEGATPVNGVCRYLNGDNYIYSIVSTGSNSAEFCCQMLNINGFSIGDDGKIHASIYID